MEEYILMFTIIITKDEHKHDDVWRSQQDVTQICLVYAVLL